MQTLESRPVDDFMKAKILARIGRTEGRVEIFMEHWDFGYCETCSWPETGLAVTVDGKTVCPADEVLAAFGRCAIGDDEMDVSEGQVTQLSQYGRFFDWLDGKDLRRIADEEDDA